MKRSEFIRRSLLGLVGAAIVPSLPKIIFSTTAKKIVEYKTKRVVMFKVTESLLADKDFFDMEIKSVTEKYFNLEESKNLTVEVGLQDDDFVRQIYTVMLTAEIE